MRPVSEPRQPRGSRRRNDTTQVGCIDRGKTIHTSTLFLIERWVLNFLLQQQQSDHAKMWIGAANLRCVRTPFQALLQRTATHSTRSNAIIRRKEYIQGYLCLSNSMYNPTPMPLFLNRFPKADTCHHQAHPQFSASQLGLSPPPISVPQFAPRLEGHAWLLRRSACMLPVQRR